MIDVFQIKNLETLRVTAEKIREEIKHDVVLLKIQQALEKRKSLVSRLQWRVFVARRYYF